MQKKLLDCTAGQGQIDENIPISDEAATAPAARP